jgi:hypothetical protein
MTEEVFLQRSFFLSVVPHGDLLGNLKRKKIKTEKLKEKYSELFGKEVKNPIKAIEKLPHYKLVNFFIKFKILSIEEEKELYFQFRDSDNPIFYLYKYKTQPFTTINNVKNGIEKEFKKVKLGKFEFELSNTVETPSVTSSLRYKDFKIVNNSIHEENILEFKFEFLEKIKYLDPNYIPRQVYSLKFGLFWVDTINNLVIIKCQAYKIVEVIINFLEKIFKTSFWKFNLQKSMVDKIFDFNELVKISLASRKEINKLSLDSITIIDKDYAEKLKDPVYKFLLNYERKMGSYFTDIEGFSDKTKVSVAEIGKISLIGKKIPIDKCRGWLITILIKLMKIQEEFLISKDFKSYINSHDYIRRTKLYNYLKNKKAQEKMYELVEKVISLKNQPELEAIEFHFPFDVAYYFQDYLISTVNLRCSKEDCNAVIMCPNEGCDSTSFKTFKKFGDNTLSVRCSNCKTEISKDVEIECLDNHKQFLSKNEAIAFLFNLDIKTELNKIFKNLDIGFTINSENEIFYIKENKLYRFNNNDKILYNWDELPSFKDIPKLKDLHPTVQKAQAINITQILEKCKKYKGKCRSCHILKDEDEICLSKIFSKISEGQAHPHSGAEYGDFEFPQKFLDQTEILYGIAKSYKKTPSITAEFLLGISFGKLTYKNSDNLLEQFIEACMDDSVRFILVVSGRIIESRLKSILIEISRWKKKKVTFIEPKELIPIFAHYFDKVSK